MSFVVTAGSGSACRAYIFSIQKITDISWVFFVRILFLLLFLYLEICGPVLYLCEMDFFCFRLREEEHPAGDGPLGETHLHQVRQQNHGEGLYPVPTWVLRVSIWRGPVVSHQWPIQTLVTGFSTKRLSRILPGAEPLDQISCPQLQRARKLNTTANRRWNLQTMARFWNTLPGGVSNRFCIAESTKRQQTCSQNFFEQHRRKYSIVQLLSQV